MATPSLSVAPPVDPPRCGTTAAAPAPAGGAPVIDSLALLQGGRIVTIRHQGEFYRLQATRQGKLILTK
jgi:hemin uptake protein HemP